MTKELKKNFSLIATLAVIVITSVVGYYVIGLKRAPYPVANFESFSLKWGTVDSLQNTYSSANGIYTYLNNSDSLIRTQVKLRSNEIIFLHNRINELGFWNLPNKIGEKKPNSKASFYELQFNYKEKSKKITVYSDFDENPLLLDSAMQIITLVQQAIDEAEGRYHR
ncbi:hypothetical protein WG904_13105 [Pedobacter sp. Du54]|uniref:hypothetical protein n=1 Tax=Pedobacter anseongensis TaxID=3133439 RepID=UPI0030A04C4D